MFLLQKVSSVYILLPSKVFVLVLYKLLSLRIRPCSFNTQRKGDGGGGWGFCKRGLLKKKIARLHNFITFCVTFISLFFLSFLLWNSVPPWSVAMHESLVIGCRGYCSQRVDLNVRLWDDGQKGHLWLSRRVITKVTQGSHIWEDVNKSVEVESIEQVTGNRKKT